MLSKILMLTVSLLTTVAASATPSEGFIRQNAVQVSTDDLPRSILPLLTSTKLLMIGEMHGTHESPKLVE